MLFKKYNQIWIIPYYHLHSKKQKRQNTIQIIDQNGPKVHSANKNYKRLQSIDKRK